MFVWTAAKVLAAIDAGIIEVIRMHNNALAVIWTNGDGVKVVGGERVKVQVGPARAYELAMEQTVATLNAIEDVLGFDGDDDPDVWALVMDAPDNFGIERDPIPMFTAIAA